MNETKRKTLHYKNLPLRSPVGTGILWWIALDYFHANAVVWGIVGTIFVLYVGAFIAERFNGNFTEL